MKGHIRERSPGNWAIVIDTTDAATGKRKRKWHSFKGTKRQAQEECARLVTAVKGGTYIEPSRTTTAEYLDRWLDSIKPNISAKSHQRYTELCRKNIAPLIGSVTLAKLAAPQIAAAYAKAIDSGGRLRAGGLSPRTVHHMHVALKSALQQAVLWGLLVRNPCDAVRPPRYEKPEMRTYDMAQTAIALDTARPTRMFIPTILALLCGLRRGEIAALRWRHVDLAAGRISVIESAEQVGNAVRLKPTKTGRGRNVALTGTALEELKAWRLRQAQECLKLGMRPNDDTFIVTSSIGEPVQPANLTRRWKIILEGSGLPMIRFHDLRHSHATHMLGSGVHPKIASERLGHSKIGITLDLYSHVLPGMQEDAAAKVDAALKAAQKDGR